jgi:hypothetical protein
MRRANGFGLLRAAAFRPARVFAASIKLAYNLFPSQLSTVIRKWMRRPYRFSQASLRGGQARTLAFLSHYE